MRYLHTLLAVSNITNEVFRQLKSEMISEHRFDPKTSWAFRLSTDQVWIKDNASGQCIAYPCARLHASLLRGNELHEVKLRWNTREELASIWLIENRLKTTRLAQHGTIYAPFDRHVPDFLWRLSEAYIHSSYHPEDPPIENPYSVEETIALLKTL